MCNNLLLIFMRGRKLITTRFIMVRSCHEKVFKKFQESLLLCNSVQSKIVKKHTFTRVQYEYRVAWSIFYCSSCRSVVQNNFCFHEKFSRIKCHVFQSQIAKKIFAKNSSFVGPHYI